MDSEGGSREQGDGDRVKEGRGWRDREDGERGNNEEWTGRRNGIRRGGQNRGRGRARMKGAVKSDGEHGKWCCCAVAERGAYSAWIRQRLLPPLWLPLIKLRITDLS